jgi:hypothetical protein
MMLAAVDTTVFYVVLHGLHSDLVMAGKGVGVDGACGCDCGVFSPSPHLLSPSPIL